MPSPPVVPKVTVEVLESQAGVLWLGLEEGKPVMCPDVTAREACLSRKRKWIDEH